MDWLRVVAFVLVLLLVLAAGLTYSMLAGTDEETTDEQGRETWRSSR